MKKARLLVMSALCLFGLSANAQEEDVTSYIQNAGFDEDLTFQADGTMKEAVSTNTSLSARSWAYIAADNTVYARPKESSSQSRPDGRKMEAVNGFAGQISGWVYEGAEFPKCEWTYFGSVPYDLGETAVPIADDGSTYMTVPARPENGEFEAGAGFVYLRAGWSGKAIYKQHVNLPPAYYRLEYWTININPNTTAVATDLTQITCRRDVFKDEEGSGMQSQVWTKHEFEFAATADFTMQFGYQAANSGSGGQPIVALDGIKLYRIGEVDPNKLVNSDLYALTDSLGELTQIAEDANLTQLATEIWTYRNDISDLIDDGTLEEKNAALKDVEAKVEYFKTVIEAAEGLDAIVARLETILSMYDFPGKTAFEEVVSRISNYYENGSSEQILGVADEADAAIAAYLFSQTASTDTPADVTMLLVNPDYEDNNNEGWSGDAPAFQSYGNAEFFNKNYTYYQTVKGARPGVYAVKVRAYYRAGSKDDSYNAFLIQNNRNAKVYAETAAGEVRFPVVNQYAGGADNDLGYTGTVNINEEIYVPNNMETAAAFFDEDINENAANYDNTLYFILPEGEMNIGLQKKTQLSTDWTLFDSWSLNYYGNEADAYQMVFEKTKDAYELPDDQYVVSIPYLQAFETVAPASNVAADIVAALNALEEAYDTLTTNAQLWLDLEEVRKEAEAVAADTNYDPAYTASLGEWAESMEQLLANPQLTNEELLALIAEKTAAIEESYKHPSPTLEDMDVTYLLVNPDFETGKMDGWTVNRASGGNVSAGLRCAEAWNNSSFDIYQVIENIPAGIYKLTMQGFYRYLRGDNAYNAYKEQSSAYVTSEGTPVFVYLNENQAPFKNVFSETVENAEFYPDGSYYQSPDDTYFPNNFESSTTAYDAGMYKQEVTVEIRSEGQSLRVGVKGATNQGGDSWACFSNFRLTYSGLQSQTTGISTVNAETKSQQIYDLQGRRVNRPAKGLYIKNGAKYLSK